MTTWLWPAPRRKTIVETWRAGKAGAKTPLDELRVPGTRELMIIVCTGTTERIPPRRGPTGKGPCRIRCTMVRPSGVSDGVGVCGTYAAKTAASAGGSSRNVSAVEENHPRL